MATFYHRDTPAHRIEVGDLVAMRGQVAEVIAIPHRSSVTIRFIIVFRTGESTTGHRREIVRSRAAIIKRICPPLFSDHDSSHFTAEVP
jgi:hypothetical protein